MDSQGLHISGFPWSTILLRKIQLMLSFFSGPVQEPRTNPIGLVTPVGWTKEPRIFHKELRGTSTWIFRQRKNASSRGLSGILILILTLDSTSF
jgi:hypothetical protein